MVHIVFRAVAMIIVILLLVSHLRSIDENNMDSYDRSFIGNAGDGRSRGITGNIYDKDGKINVWMTLTDTNPLWSY